MIFYVLIIVLVIQVISFTWLNFYVLMNALLIIQQILAQRFISVLNLIFALLIYFFKFRNQKFTNINYVWISFSLFFIYFTATLFYLIYRKIWKIGYRVIIYDWVTAEDFLSQTLINIIISIIYIVFSYFILKNQKITHIEYFILIFCLLINSIIPFITVLQIYSLSS